jgi:5-methylcytosine-specific restriction endonuclease McrA
VPDFEQLNFADAYYLARDVRHWFVEYPDDDELDDQDILNVNDHDVLCRLARPYRWSLLHYFIRKYFHGGYIVDFEHQRDDMLALITLEYTTILELHSISIPDLDIPDDEMEDNYEPRMYAAIEALRSLLPIEAIANSAFQLLFGDRTFLLAFNWYVARRVRTLPATEHPELLERDGMLRRVRLPSWAKQGVFFRDRGRCASCLKDLSGIIATGGEAHYDHIVPRALGGCNDPANFQLLCSNCNLTKGDEIRAASAYHPVYWKL